MATPEATHEGRTMTVTGNLTADPVGGALDSGRIWARLTIASAEPYRTQTGWEQRPTEFTQVVLFGTAAENVLNTYHAKDRVTATGRPSLDTYTNEDGLTTSHIQVMNAKVTAAPLPEKATTGIDRTTATVSVQTSTASPLSINNPDTGPLTVTGVSKEDVDTHKILKSHGIRWDRATKHWSAPTDASPAARSAIVTALTSGPLAERISTPTTTAASHSAGESTLNAEPQQTSTGIGL